MRTPDLHLQQQQIPAIINISGILLASIPQYLNQKAYADGGN
jgi:hypothetical protein